MSCCGYSQLAQEGFETWPPAGWGIYDNGSGTTVTWEQTDPLNSNFPPYQGTYAAFLQRENVIDTNPVPQDWLITPQFTAPENPQLRFYSRLTLGGNQGGIYKVMLSTNATQGNLSQYALEQQWTELEINPSQESYNEIIVDLPQTLAGQQIYIAFVMEADFKDRWLIDNVKVVERCLEVEGLTAFGMTETTANLSWDSPGDATSWEIEILPVGVTPTGTGTVYNGTLPYAATGLTYDTDYKYYVRAICTGNVSEWVGPFNFSTQYPGANCLAPRIVGALPFTHADNTADYGIDYSGVAGTSCGSDPSMESFGGNDVVYQFTPATDMVVEISVSNLSAGYAGVYVYTDCADIGTQCYAGDANQELVVNLSTGQVNVSAGTTYYIIIATPSFIESTSYILNIQEIQCPMPSSVQVSGVTTTGAQITWVEFGDATSWEYVLQPAGTGTPTGSGTTTATLGFNPSGLTLNTAYEFYVRSVCGPGEYSAWNGPLNFNTLCNPFTLPFTEGFNSGSATENCWTTVSYSGAAFWNMDNTNDPFEGDEAAVFDPEFNDANHDWLISPAITLTGNNRLRFHHKVTGFWGSDNDFKVMMSTTGIDPEDFTTEILPTSNYSGGDYTEKEIFLNDIPAGTVFFAWVTEEGGTGAIHIDNVIIDDIPPCPEPTALTADNLTQTTAELSWTAGYLETTWEVVVQPVGTGEPTAAGTPATNPFIATGLEPDTHYEYYVRAICGGTDGNSIWVGPYEFRTGCEAFDVPFYEGFNSDSATEHCWTINNVNGGFDDWFLGNEDEPYEGDESARYNSEFTSTNDDWLITPAINLTANNRLTFQHRLYSYMYQVAMEVRISTTGTAPEDFTQVLLPAETYTNPFFIKEVIDLSAYTGTVYIAWHAPGGPDSGMYFFLDDVRIEAIPDCADPYNLQVNNITISAAQLSWTPGNGETQWEVVVQPATNGAPTAGGVITSNNPYTATGLLSGTSYEYYVRSVCAGTNSIWNGPYPFITLITNDECANATPVPVNPGSECIVSVSGTVSGASLSPQTPYCDMAPNDDVWFEFTATATTHNITISNISEFSFIRFALYHGDECGDNQLVMCDNFQNSVNFSGLIIGDVYKIRAFTGQFLQTATFEVCVRTPQPPIAVDNTTYTVEQLVTDVLVGTQCAQISNVTWSTGTNFPPDGDGVPNPNGIAYFSQNGSIFPMEGGVLLTTGNAMSAAGPETGILSDGSAEWTGDADLDAIVLAETGIPMNSTNSTTLEFDFIPLIDNLSFEFLFASEEYGDFQCDFSDTFAFLLTDADGNTVNLALVPGTSQPVSVVTVRDSQYNDNCESANAEYFDSYTAGVDAPLAPTNFQGQTVSLTASTIVVPNAQYHIKMVIADRGGEFEDTAWDSAVFLAAGSFNIGNANLGADLTVADGTAICANEVHIIVSGMSPDIFTFKWFKDNVEITGETGPDLEVDEAGTYKLEAEVNGQDCFATDSILIEFYPAVEDITQSPADMEVCSLTGTASFDLTQNNALIIGTQNPANFVITYHSTVADAESGTNALVSPYENIAPTQAIYVRVVYVPTGCYGIHNFSLMVAPAPVYAVTPDTVICAGGTVTLEVTSTAFDVEDADYAWTLGGVALPDNTAAITATAEGVYVVTVNLNGCITSSTINVALVTTPIVDTPEDVTACTGYELPALTSGNYFTGEGGTGTMLEAGALISTTQTLYVFAGSGGCTAQHVFEVTILPIPDVAVTGDCQGNNYVLQVNFLDNVYHQDNVTIEWKNGAGTIIGENSPTVTVTGEDTYTVTVSPINLDCPATRYIEVDEVICIIQKGISPGDGSLNENFDLTDLNVKNLTIFNRYGQEVYSLGNYTNEWSGQDKSGNELPTGTYFYMFERDNGETKTGWIYVNRLN